MVILDYKLRLHNFSAFSCKGNNMPLLVDHNQNQGQEKSNNQNQNPNQGIENKKKNNNQKEKNEDNLFINNLNKIEEGKKIFHIISIFLVY